MAGFSLIFLKKVPRAGSALCSYGHPSVLGVSCTPLGTAAQTRASPLWPAASVAKTHARKKTVEHCGERTMHKFGGIQTPGLGLVGRKRIAIKYVYFAASLNPKTDARWLSRERKVAPCG